MNCLPRKMSHTDLQVALYYILQAGYGRCGDCGFYAFSAASPNRLQHADFAMLSVVVHLVQLERRMRLSSTKIGQAAEHKTSPF